ncbi:MAG: DUF2240 family protein [Candidatus Hydrothermarchaeaceae archaeon]
MALQAMIKTISGESGLDEEEIASRIEKKRDELSGLVTPEGAAYIVAKELGLNLFKGEPRSHDLKVENVIPGMTRVDIMGKVVKVYPVKEFNKKNGSTGLMGSLILGDDTGTVRVVFWEKAASLLSEGHIEEEQVLRIKKGYTKENQDGEAEIHINNASKITANPTDVEPGDIQLKEMEPTKLGELREGMNSVDVFCKVMHIYDAREFERDDKTKGRVVNMVVADETSRARLVLWDEDVGMLDRGEVNVGDTIKVEKGYVKMRYGEPEINVGKYGKVVLNPPGGELDVELPSAVVATREIKGLRNGDRAAIRGALVELYEPKVFQRKDGKRGVVVNAAIDDGTACMRAAFYDKQAEALLNTSLEGENLEEKVVAAAEERKNEVLGSEVIATVDVRHNDFSGQDEMVVRDISISPDPREIIKELLKEIKIMEG